MQSPQMKYLSYTYISKKNEMHIVKLTFISKSSFTFIIFWFIKIFAIWCLPENYSINLTLSWHSFSHSLTFLIAVTSSKLWSSVQRNFIENRQMNQYSHEIFYVPLWDWSRCVFLLDSQKGTYLYSNIHKCFVAIFFSLI